MTTSTSTDLESAGVPLYRRIASVLQEEITAGRWKPGEQIPTEKELLKRFAASQGTLRLAILELVKTGLVRRRQGLGTFVREPRFENSLSRFFRYTRSEGDAPIVPQTSVLGVQVVAPDRRVAKALRLAEGQKVARVRRLRTVDGEPFLLIESYFAERLWRRIADVDLGVVSLYDVLRDRYDVHIVRADEFLSAGLATAQEADVLGIEAGGAVIRLERHAFTYRDKPIEFRRSVGRGDRFQYHVRL